MKPFTLGVPRDPHEVSNVQVADDGGPYADADADGVDWSGSRGPRRFAQTAF